MPASQKTLHMIMHGKVQGVWFRDSMRREAVRLGIGGWVRNRVDGAVEAVVQGEEQAVDAIVQWAHRGPRLAQVTRVEIVPVGGDYVGFTIEESV